MPARCPDCQATYDDATTFCTRDGARLVHEGPIAPASTNRTGLVLGVLGGLVVGLALVLAILVFRPTPEPRVVVVPEREVYTQGEALGGGRPPDAAPAAEVEAPVEAAPRAAPPPPDRDLVPVGRAPAPSAASSGPARVVTEGDGLLLRDGPGTQYAVLGKMLPGDVVTAEGCESGTPGRRWCTVVYGGIRGWALDGYLDIGGPAEDTESGLEQAFASAERVGRAASIDGSKVRSINLRARPFAEGELLTELRPGTPLVVGRCLPYGWSLGGRAIRGRWCFVTARPSGRSISGWASDGALRW